MPRIAEYCVLFVLNDEVIRFPALAQLRYFLGIWHPTGCAASCRYIFIWRQCCTFSRYNIHMRVRFLFPYFWPHFSTCSVFNADVNQILEEITYTYCIVFPLLYVYTDAFIRWGQGLHFTRARSLAFISDAILAINQIKWWNIKIGWLIFRVCVKILFQRAYPPGYISSGCSWLSYIEL